MMRGVRFTIVAKVLAASLAVVSSICMAIGAWQWVSSGVILEKASRMTGLVVENISVHGANNVSEGSAVAASGCDLGTPMLRTNIWHIKQNLEARLKWVRKAVVVRKFPNTIDIYLEERVAAAIWNDTQDNTVVIDADGNIIMHYLGGDKFAGLTLLKGANANLHIKDAKEILSVDHITAGHVSFLTRVGDRRWTVSMKNGVEVMLPEEDCLDAWRRAVEILNSNDTMPIKAIDMRVANKVFFVRK